MADECPPQAELRAAIDVGRRELGRAPLADGETPAPSEVEAGWLRVGAARQGTHYAAWLARKDPASPLLRRTGHGG